MPLASDGSVHVRLPSLTPLIVELQDGSGNKLMTMSEEDQLGPGERISRGVPQKFFNSVCARLPRLGLGQGARHRHRPRRAHRRLGFALARLHAIDWSLSASAEQ